MVILENIDIDIDIDKAILQNMDIDKISNRFKYGISNRATCMTTTVEFQLTYGWNIKLNIGQAIQIVEVSRWCVKQA